MLFAESKIRAMRFSKVAKRNATLVAYGFAFWKLWEVAQSSEGIAIAAGILLLSFPLAVAWAVWDQNGKS